MGWLSKFLGSVPREERDGIKLDVRSAFWEVEGPKTFSEVLRALDDWLPDDSVLYFESGSPDKTLSKFMAANAIPEQTHVAFGAVWPRPRVYHVPATHDCLGALAEIMEHHAEPELAIHFHVYCRGRILLEWYDAFSQSMLMSGDISEDRIKDFSQRIGTKYKRRVL